MGNVKRGQQGRIARVRERERGGTKYYLYDVAWNHGTETRNVYDKSIELPQNQAKAQAEAIEAASNAEKAEAQRVKDEAQRVKDEQARKEREEMEARRRQADAEDQERMRIRREEKERERKQWIRENKPESLPRGEQIELLLERAFGTLIDLDVKEATERYANAPEGSDDDDVVQFSMAVSQALGNSSEMKAQAKAFVNKVVQWKTQTPVPQPNDLAKRMDAALEQPYTPPIIAQTPKTLTIEQGFHTKKKIPIWIAKINGSKPRDEYERIAAQVKEIGGYYSSFAKGFVFEEKNPTEDLQARGLADSVELHLLSEESVEEGVSLQENSLTNDRNDMFENIRINAFSNAPEEYTETGSTYFRVHELKELSVFTGTLPNMFAPESLQEAVLLDSRASQDEEFEGLQGRHSTKYFPPTIHIRQNIELKHC